MKVIGIVGYPGVGKSTVCKIFEKKGAFYINLDAIVHKLYEPNGHGTHKVEAFFGHAFLKKDGSVNRTKLRKVVFGNAQKLKILETFIHPFVLHEVKLLLEKSNNKIVVIEVTVYRRDAKLNELIDEWVLVKRKEKSEKFDLSEFHEDLEYLQPDFVIENDGDEEMLAKIVAKIDLYV